MNIELISFFALLILVFQFYCWFYKIGFNKDDKFPEKWLSPVMVTGGLFVAMVFIFSNLQESLKNEYVFTSSSIVTLLMWLIGHRWIQRDPSFQFRADKETSTFVKVSGINGNDIPIYPRFSIYEKVNELEEGAASKSLSGYKNIFDSSDFSVVNKAFDTIEDHQSFVKGGQFKLKGVLFEAKKVQISLLYFFDDYSRFSYRPEYEGKRVPYNIQIIVYAKRLK